MSFIQNHFDGQNHELIAAQKAFKKAMDNKVNEIVESSLPEILKPIILQAAEELAENVPDVLRKPDSVTGDALDEKAIYMRMLFACSNALGHGGSWLR